MAYQQLQRVGGALCVHFLHAFSQCVSHRVSLLVVFLCQQLFGPRLKKVLFGDTILLAYHGSPRSTRFLAPAAMAADIARRNRYLGAEIHAVRVGDSGRDSKRLMKSIATASGGQFREAKD